ncbi:hypothetical protein GDO86_020639 [Hymenochirus boettgeri]|uniref:Beta-defensin n=1 Tax=Hymenochirus boettgeri TaxID=247094 RepID=A0A8T2IM92_9PIPI|nr:hypothetical protein GDO86_020639 [Hymenochirus boettgeri]
MRINIIFFLVLFFSLAAMRVDAYFGEANDDCKKIGGRCGFICSIHEDELGTCTLAPMCCRRKFG